MFALMYVHSLLSILAAIFVFLFAISKFSRQIQGVAGDTFKSTIRSFTATPLRGTFIGTIFTALIQSSTATTVMLVGLVDAGLISFTNSLGVIFGANIGTTITSQLVAFNVASIAPYIIIIGFVLDKMRSRYQAYGKAIFYFGLVFLCLGIISLFIEPLRNDPFIVLLFSKISNYGIAILAGVLITTFFQASGIVAGFTVLLAAQGLLDFDQAFGIILGANIGTASTALIASSVLNTSARRTALAHLLFNVIGVVVILPFLPLFKDMIQWFDGNVARQIAHAHVAFNIISTLVFLLFITPFAKLVTSLIKENR